MRCLSCNTILSNKEATRKYAESGEFIDLCDDCFSHVSEDIPHLEGHGTDGKEEYEEEE